MDLVNELYRLADIFTPDVLVKAGMAAAGLSIFLMVWHLVFEAFARNLDS